eukprot:scaffold9096_cov145-Isochrysis_galbana.AAC.2
MAGVKAGCEGQRVPGLRVPVGPVAGEHCSQVRGLNLGEPIIGPSSVNLGESILEPRGAGSGPCC